MSLVIQENAIGRITLHLQGEGAGCGCALGQLGPAHNQHACLPCYAFILENPCIVNRACDIGQCRRQFLGQYQIGEVRRSLVADHKVKVEQRTLPDQRWCRHHR